ncbi:hypothetical protein [Pimelobacter simplex]|uniref:hypothetical protein n=1 Tax=Nocardioides simplex TaxID=2045 RepID=UPI003AAE3146
MLEGVTINDDFTDRTSDVPAILRARRPAWVGIQEGKREDYADLLEDARYGVEQRMTTAATRGVALVYDRDQVRTVGTAVDQPRRVGRGYQQLTPAGHGILARGVVWQDVCVRGPLGRRRRVRIASTHRHPKRASAMWPEFDDALATWLAASPIPVWLDLDANAPLDRIDLSAAHAFHVRNARRLWRGIDGHIITGPLRFALRPAKRLRRRTSDHRGVAALVRIPRLPRRNR